MAAAPRPVYPRGECSGGLASSQVEIAPGIRRPGLLGSLAARRRVRSVGTGGCSRPVPGTTHTVVSLVSKALQSLNTLSPLDSKQRTPSGTRLEAAPPGEAEDSQRVEGGVRETTDHER